GYDRRGPGPAGRGRGCGPHDGPPHHHGPGWEEYGPGPERRDPRHEGWDGPPRGPGGPECPDDSMDDDPTMETTEE
ncbi:hypothetical protein LJC74_10525, partial [Eubacteriales bacterium OttesenSCG-928-A19]|nr:hypothetical protein [Eubacteriales bacterium OttesenSCG-928-A19]